MINQSLYFQAQDRQLEPRPMIEDPLENHIEAVRAMKATLRKPEVRSENGVIIIDD